MGVLPDGRRGLWHSRLLAYFLYRSLLFSLASFFVLTAPV